MSTAMQRAQSQIFGELGATNVKLFPGNSRDATSEDVAAELLKGLAELASGEAENVEI